MASRWLPMEFAYDTRGFRRSLRLHAAGVIVLGAVGVLLLRFSDRLFLPALLVLVAAVCLFAVMLVSPLPPTTTKHVVTGSAVVLRQGWFFTRTVPFSSIAGIKLADDMPGKTGVGVSRGDASLYVLSSGRGVVRIDLREPVVVRRVAVDRILLDAEDPEGFVACVRERMGRGGPPRGPRKETAGETAPRAEGRETPPEKGAAPPLRDEAREAEAGGEAGGTVELESVEELVVPVEGRRAGEKKEGPSGAEPGRAEEELEELELEPAWTGGSDAEPRVMRVRVPKRGGKAGGRDSGAGGDAG